MRFASLLPLFSRPSLTPLRPIVLHHRLVFFFFFLVRTLCCIHRMVVRDSIGRDDSGRRSLEFRSNRATRRSSSMTAPCVFVWQLPLPTPPTLTRPLVFVREGVFSVVVVGRFFFFCFRSQTEEKPARTRVYVLLDRRHDGPAFCRLFRFEGNPFIHKDRTSSDGLPPLDRKLLYEHALFTRLSHLTLFFLADFFFLIIYL